MKKPLPSKWRLPITKKKTAIATERFVLYNMFTTSSFKLIDLPHVRRFASTKYVRKAAISDILLSSFQVAKVEGFPTGEQSCNDKIYLLQH